MEAGTIITNGVIQVAIRHWDSYVGDDKYSYHKDTHNDDSPDCSSEEDAPNENTSDPMYYINLLLEHGINPDEMIQCLLEIKFSELKGDKLIGMLLQHTV